MHFDDGDEACRSADLVVLDAPMARDAVKVGARVLAKWTDGRYYPATVIGEPGPAKARVRFDDDAEHDATIEDFRAL